MNSLSTRGTPKITAIVPTYNRARYLPECIESLLNQEVPLHEIIVVDDGSEDTTPAVLRSFEGTIRYFRKNNEGKSSALNLGIGHATGDWLWFFDDDDVALPGASKTLLNALFKDSASCWAYSPHFMGKDAADGRIRAEHSRRLHLFPGSRFKFELFKRHAFFLQGTLIKRDAVEAIGGFDERFLRAQDYEFIIRLACSFKATCSPEPTFIWRQHDGDRGTKSEKHSRAERDLVWLRYEQRIGIDTLRKQPLEHMLDSPQHLCNAQATQKALVRRAAIMAHKGLPCLMLEDIIESTAYRTESAFSIDVEDAADLLEAANSKYFLSSLNEELQSFINLAYRHQDSAPIRRTLALICRALLFQLRQRDCSISQRKFLLFAWWKIARLCGVRALRNAYVQASYLDNEPREI